MVAGVFLFCIIVVLPLCRYEGMHGYMALSPVHICTPSESAIAACLGHRALIRGAMVQIEMQIVPLQLIALYGAS